MASEGPLSVGQGTNDATIGDTAWTDPGNVLTSNNLYAQANVQQGNTSQYLVGDTCGFAIPGGATIDGIIADYERSKSSGVPAITDNAVLIVRDGTIGGVNSQDKSTATEWPGAEAYEEHGGAADLWNENWTDALVNDSANFGFVVSFVVGASAPANFSNGRVDHMRMTVHYTAGVAGIVLFRRRIEGD